MAASSRSRRRARKCLCLEDKMKVLKEFKTGKTVMEIVQLLQFRISKSQVYESGIVRIVLQSTPLLAAQNTPK